VAALCASFVQFSPQAHAQHGLLREVYTNILGGTVDSLLASPSYPGNPGSTTTASEFEAPDSPGDSFGQRLRGYLEAPQTGAYIFYIASDDGSRLYLSTDEKPENMQQIAEVFSFTDPRNWEDPFEVNQKSSPVQLEAGRRYYVQALGVDGSGADHLSVRWQLPDGTFEGPIPNERLYVELIPPQITRQPAGATVTEGGVARFTVQTANLGPLLYQWYRNDQLIAGATNASLIVPNVQVTDSGSYFQVRLFNAFAANGVASSLAFLTVAGDTEPPAIATAQTTGENDLLAVTFTERVEKTSAENLANYALEGGARLLSAALTEDGLTVIFNTSPLAAGDYLLIVNNVRDRSSLGNVIEPDSFAEFSFGYAPLAPDLVYGRPESPGPSTRRTGLVISEIMHHPVGRADGRNLEFIEIYNSQESIQTVGGHQLAGVVNYTFPEGTFVPPRGYLVVAAAPADVQVVHGLPRVLGPYEGSLPDSGTLQLLNDLGAVLLEIPYASDGDWPSAPDGAGPSLVLSRASYGEADPRAWSASDANGGSPGRAEAAAVNPYRGLVINEILAHTDLPQLDFVELYNYGPAEIDLSGVVITDDADTNKFVVPNGTRIPSLGFARFDEVDLGFRLSSGGERVLVRNPQRSRVIDALRFGPQANGISIGRFPDGNPAIKSLARPTPNAANSRPLLPAVVINEIMYNPVSGNQDEEYVELHNRSGAAVSLLGWQIGGGISYTFTQDFALAPGAYVVIAKSPSALRNPARTNLSDASLLGGYNGSLANGGERITLERPELLITIEGARRLTNVLHVVVDEVKYNTGGRWPHWADGGGSSLELVSPNADNDDPSNWADSDETAKSEWVTIERRGILDHGATNLAAANPSRDLHVILLDGGEALLDNVEVIPDGGTNLIANSGLERGANGWQWGGTHEATTVERGSGVNRSSALRIRASERGDTAANRIRARMNGGLTNGMIATIRAQARWLRGTPDLLLRLHGNYLEAAGVMPLPRNLGTPGAPNSRAAANTGPAIAAVQHSPLLPVAGQDVTVIAEVEDPDRVAIVTLNYRIDPSTNAYVRVPMNYQGAGYYAGTIPGQSNLVTATFYIDAVDARGVISHFPASGPAAAGVVLFGDRNLNGSLATYHIWLSSANLNRWAQRERSSNHRIDATFVYNSERAVYNMGALYSGSPFHWGNYNSPIGNSANYVMTMPEDDRLLGQTDFVLMLPSNLGSDNTGVREQTAFWIAGELNQPHNYRRYHHLFINGRNRGLSGTTQRVYEDVQQPNRDMLEQWYPQRADGDLHKTEDWFEYNDSFGFFNLDSELLAVYTTNLATGQRELKHERYRQWFRKRAVRGSAHDYSELKRLVEAANNPDHEQYVAQVAALVDIDEWMGAIAFRHVVGDWDAFGYTRGKNMYAYKPPGGKWQLLHWDIAFSFGLGDSPTEDLFNVTHFDGTIDSITKRMMDTPVFRRSYLRTLYEAANGPLLPSRVNPVIDSRFNGLLANGITATSPDAVKQWISQRRDYIVSQVAGVTAGFGITSNGGASFTTNRNSILLTGTAPVNVKTIRVNGLDYPVTWTSVTAWQIRLALNRGQNLFRLEGYDQNGALISEASDAIAINVTGQGDPIAGRVVFNEILFYGAGGAEFVELHNTSRTTSYDLFGYRINGLGFTFAPGSVIAPGGFLVVAADAEAFGDAFGFTVPLAGVFAGTLDTEGEALSLLAPPTTPGAGETQVSAVRYDNVFPWPIVVFFGPEPGQILGTSIQLIDPAQEITRAANWAAQAGVATPGAVNSTRGTQAPFPPLWLNEVLPQNLAGLTDSAGDRDPWIELYNSGASAVSLAGFFLSDDSSTLGKWPFPAGASIGAGQRIVIWLDGEPGESTATEWHTSFRPRIPGLRISLSTLRGSTLTALDFLANRDALSFETVPAGWSYGSYPDGQGVYREAFSKPTPAAPNELGGAGVPVFINEWMASNTGTIQDPDDLDFDDWFELYNAGSTAVDLSGYTLSDDFGNVDQYRIPVGTSIPARGFLLVWADNENADNRQLHASFRLSADGDRIGLFAPDGSTVDSVEFGAQLPDVSEGRSPDGGARIQALAVATPGASNGGIDPNALQFTSVRAAGADISMTWNSQSGETYQIQYKANLGDAAWTTLRSVTASGASSTATDPASGQRRFYRIARQ